MAKLSIIVPVYNVEHYLEKCLNSLVNQTLDDIEIIIVNDGSPDRSQKIIDKYAKKYGNIKSYIKKNGGLSDARNYGLKKANGDYIAFVDSDDYVSNNMYKEMYDKAIAGDFDIVVCDLNYVYDEKIVKCSSNINKDTNDIKKVMLNVYPAAWNKIYKKCLFVKGVEFKKGIWFEDVEFSYRLLPYVKSIGVVKENFYYYIQRDGSITNTKSKKLFDYIDNWNGIIEYYKENDLYNEYKKELEYCYVRYVYATFVKRACMYDKNDYYNAVDVAIKNVKESFPNYRKNKYFYKSFKGLYLVSFNRCISKILFCLNRK